MTNITVRREYEREGFEQLIEGLEGLLVAGMHIDQQGNGSIDQREIERLGLDGLQQMLGDQTLKMETLGLQRIGQIIGLMGRAAEEHKKGYSVRPQSRLWMDQGP